MADQGRFAIPELDQPNTEDMRSWGFQVRAQMASINGFLPVYQAARAADPNGAIVWPAGAPGVAMNRAAAKLYAAVMAALKGAALRIVVQLNANDIVTVMRTLEGEFLRNQVIDQNINVADFYGTRFDDGKYELRDWINRKYAILLECPQLIPVAGRNAAMTYALTSLMPEAFDEVVNRCRTEAGLQWQDIRDRLIDWDRSNPKSKREKQNKALMSQVQALNARLQTIENSPPKKNEEALECIPVEPAQPAETAGVRANLADQFWGTCHKCKKWGHSARFCTIRTVRKDDDKGGKNKSGKKGKGKKGGKGGKGGRKGKNRKW